jgi:antitoxin HicB
MFQYAVVLQKDDNDTILVTCPDLPEVVTFGDDEAEARARAVDAIETALVARMADRQDIPAASRPAKGQVVIDLPVLATAKLALYQAMRTQRVRKTDLANRLGLHMVQIDRLLDLRHASKIEQIETALRALGKTMLMDVRDAA